MHIINTQRIITSAARAEIRRLKKRKAVLEERKRVLEELIAEQTLKSKPPSQ